MLINVVDLKKHDFYFDNVIKLNDEEFIFGDVDLIKGKTFLNFYRYNLKSNKYKKVNKIPIEMYEFAMHLSTYTNGQYIYTSALGTHDFFDFYRICLRNGKVDKLCSVDKEGRVEILNERYALLYGADYDDRDPNYISHYELYLIDMEKKSKHKINNSDISFANVENIIKYNYEEDTKILLEERSCNNYKNKDFIVDGKDYKIYSISLNDLILSINNNSKLNINYIFKSQDDFGARLLKADEENIYYKVVNFKENKEDIYLLKKDTSDTRIIESYIYTENGSSKRSRFYDIESKQIVSQREVNGKTIVKGEKNNVEIPINDPDWCFISYVEDKLITSSLGEEILNITDLKTLDTVNYDGAYVTLDNNIILFDML